MAVNITQDYVEVLETPPQVNYLTMSYIEVLGYNVGEPVTPQPDPPDNVIVFIGA